MSFFLNKNKPKELVEKNRVWEIDAFRGFLIFSMILYHIYATVNSYCIKGGYPNLDPDLYVQKSDPLNFWFDYDSSGKIYMKFLYPFIDEFSYSGRITFFIISGLSTVFSKDNFKRGVKLFLAAYGVSFFSLGFSYALVGSDRYFIKFGILQCYAFSVLFYCLISKLKDYWQLIIGFAFIALDVIFKVFSVQSNNPFLCVMFLGSGPIKYFGYDSYPLVPYIGFFIIFAVLGKKIYKNKTTLIKLDNHKKFFGFFEFIGRHSGIIYIAQMFLIILLFNIIGHIFNLF